MRYIFDHYVEAINKLGNRFDHEVMRPYLDKALVKAGLNIKSDTFVNRFFLALEKGYFKPDPKKVNAFLNVLPYGILKNKLTDKIVKANLAKEEWSSYRPVQWIKAQKAASYIKKNKLNETTPITIVKRKGKSFTVSVFLGDVNHVLDLDLPKNQKAYADLYDAVSSEIGKNALQKRLKKKIYASNFEITNWPDVTDLNDVEYEIVFTPDDDWADSLIEETADEVAAEVKKMLS